MLDDGTPPDVIDKSSLLFDLVTVRLSPQVSAVISIEISISFIRKVTSLNGRFVAVMLTLPSHPVMFAALSPSSPSRPRSVGQRGGVTTYRILINHRQGQPIPEPINIFIPRHPAPLFFTDFSEIQIAIWRAMRHYEILFGSPVITGGGHYRGYSRTVKLLGCTVLKNKRNKEWLRAAPHYITTGWTSDAANFDITTLLC